MPLQDPNENMPSLWFDGALEYSLSLHNRLQAVSIDTIPQDSIPDRFSPLIICGLISALEEAAPTFDTATKH